MSTSGRLHSEFVRLLYILAHQRIATLNYEPCDEELCQRRGAFFFQHRARIGLASAQALRPRPFVWAPPPGLPWACADRRFGPLAPPFPQPGCCRLQTAKFRQNSETRTQRGEVSFIERKRRGHLQTKHAEAARLIYTTTTHGHIDT